MLLFLNMFEHLRAAIEERVGLGYSKEEILAELLKADYQGKEIDEYVAGFFKASPTTEFAKSRTEKEEVIASASETDSSKATTLDVGNESEIGKEGFSTSSTSGFDQSQKEFSQTNVVPAPPTPPISSIATISSGRELAQTRTSTQAEISDEVGNYKDYKKDFSVDGEKDKTADKKNLIIGGLIFALILSFITVGFFVFFSGYNNNSAPYNSIQELMVGVYEKSVKNNNSYIVDTNVSFSLGEKEVGTPVALPELFEEVLKDGKYSKTETLSLTDATMTFGLGLSSKIDQTNKDEIREDIKMNLDFDYDAIKVGGEGSVIVIGKKAYVRLDKVPKVYESSLQGIPQGQWVLLMEDSSQILDMVLNSGVGNDNKMAMNNFLTLIKGDKNLSGLLSLIGQVVVYSPLKENDGRQLASVSEYLDALPPEERELAERMLKRANGIWNQYPFIKIVDEPKKVIIENETVFVYSLKIDGDNLVKFIEGLDEAFYEEMGTGGVVAYTLKGIDLSEIVKTFNEVVSMEISVYANGVVQGNDFRVAFASGDSSKDIQIKARLKNTYHSFGEKFDIKEPTDVYPQTLIEILSGGQQSLNEDYNQVMMNDMEKRIGFFAINAPLFYKKHSNYLGVCSSLEYQSFKDFF